MKKLLSSSLLVFLLMPSFSIQAQDDSCFMVLSNGKRVNLGALCGQDSSPNTRPQQTVTPVRRTSNNGCPSSQVLYKPNGACRDKCAKDSYYTLAGNTCRPISNLIGENQSGSEFMTVIENMTSQELSDYSRALKIHRLDLLNDR